MIYMPYAGVSSSFYLEGQSVYKVDSKDGPVT